MDIPDRQMTKGAHPSCAIAQAVRAGTVRAACALAFFCPPVPAQDQGPPTWVQPLVAQCEELLDSRTPELRGEAALILASIGMPEHHPALLRVARDAQFAARIRGLVALGVLGEPGAEARLGEVLDEGTTRAGIDAAGAALALGLLPEGHPAHAVDEYLVRFRRSNYRRQREVMVSLLVGMTQDAHRSRMSALRALLEDEANRDAGIRTLLIRVLMRVPGGLEPEEVDELLSSPWEDELCAVLHSLLETGRQVSKDQLAQIARLAARDRSPKVRAVALDCLTLHRHLPALELAEDALGSADPEEAAAAVRAAARLGGGALVASLETRILEEDTATVQAAMLAAFTGFRSDDFRKGCAALAVDPARPLEVRAYAAAVAADLGDARLAPSIRRLFLDARDPEMLSVLAVALVRVDPKTPFVAEFYPSTAAEGLARLADRLRALAAAGHAEAHQLLTAGLADKELDPVTKADLLRAWRLGNWPLLQGETVLPAGLAELLR